MINFKFYFSNDLTVPFEGTVKRKFTSAETRRTNSVNDTNMAIAQMNNEYNEKLLDKQLAYNIEQWNRENEYNNPAAQVQRLKDAGLNPALFMGQGGNATGTAGSHLGINPIPASESGRQQIGNPDNGANTIQAFQGLADNLSEFGTKQSQVELNNAQAKKINVESQYTAAKAMAEIEGLKAGARSSDAKAAYDNLQTDLGKATFSDDVQRASLQNQSIEAQTGVYDAQATYLGTMAQLNNKQLEYFDRNALADLSLKASQVVKNYADADLARQMIKTEVEKALNLKEDTRGKKLNNDIVEKTTDALIRSAKAAADSAETKAKSDKREFVYGAEFDDGISQFWRQGMNTLKRGLPSLISFGKFGK